MLIKVLFLTKILSCPSDLTLMAWKYLAKQFWRWWRSLQKIPSVPRIIRGIFWNDIALSQDVLRGWVNPFLVVCGGNPSKLITSDLAYALLISDLSHCRKLKKIESLFILTKNWDTYFCYLNFKLSVLTWPFQKDQILFINREF